MLTVSAGTKEEKYKELLPQIVSLTSCEPDVTANMANAAAAIFETFGFLWVGFYRVIGNELVLGPFQGPVACTRIKYGRGVCGTAWEQGHTIVVEDVETFPGHIACSSMSRSEIVVPLKKDGVVTAVLDIDSSATATFDDTDARWLAKIADCLV